MFRQVWEVVKDKTNKTRIVEAEGERTKGKKEVQKTNGWGRNRDSKDGRREVEGRRKFDRD